MKIETRKVMKLSGIAIAATAVASATAYLTTRLLTREALDRDEPRVFQKAGNLISGYAIDFGGVNAMLGLCAAIGAVGIVCAVYAARLTGKSESRA